MASSEAELKQQLDQLQAQLSADQVEFLVSFDLGYSERRIRALVALINELYDRPGLVRPARADLDVAQRGGFGLHFARCDARRFPAGKPR